MKNNKFNQAGKYSHKKFSEAMSGTRMLLPSICRRPSSRMAASSRESEGRVTPRKSAICSRFIASETAPSGRRCSSSRAASLRRKLPEESSEMRRVRKKALCAKIPSMLRIMRECTEQAFSQVA